MKSDPYFYQEICVRVNIEFHVQFLAIWQKSLCSFSVKVQRMPKFLCRFTPNVQRRIRFLCTFTLKVQRSFVKKPQNSSNVGHDSTFSSLPMRVSEIPWGIMSVCRIWMKLAQNWFRHATRGRNRNKWPLEQDCKTLESLSLRLEILKWRFHFTIGVSMIV